MGNIAVGIICVCLVCFIFIDIIDMITIGREIKQLKEENRKLDELIKKQEKKTDKWE